MAYEPTVWKSGDLVTANKLNKLEQGVANAGGVMIVHETTSSGVSTLDKTWQEIHDALVNGSIVMILVNTSSSLASNLFIDSALYDEGNEKYEIYNIGNINPSHSTTTPDGYPTYTSPPIG